MHRLVCIHTKWRGPANPEVHLYGVLQVSTAFYNMDPENAICTTYAYFAPLRTASPSFSIGSPEPACALSLLLKPATDFSNVRSSTPQLRLHGVPLPTFRYGARRGLCWILDGVGGACFRISERALWEVESRIPGFFASASNSQRVQIPNSSGLCFQKPTPSMVFGTRVLKYWVLGPSGTHTSGNRFAKTSFR